MVSGPALSSSITTGESSSTTASAKISTSSHRHGRSGTRWCPDEHPPRSPPSFNQLDGAHVKPVAREHLSKDQRPPLVGRCEHRDGGALRGARPGRRRWPHVSVRHTHRASVPPADRLGARGQGRWCRTGLPHQDGLQHGLHRRHAGRHSLRICQTTTLKMGAERFPKDVEPIHLRIRVGAEISIATHVRIRGQPGQPNGGVRVVGHRFIKNATSLQAGCMVGFGGVDEERQSAKDQSVTTEISTRRLVDFDDLGSFGRRSTLQCWTPARRGSPSTSSRRRPVRSQGGGCSCDHSS